MTKVHFMSVCNPENCKSKETSSFRLCCKKTTDEILINELNNNYTYTLLIRGWKIMI